MKIKIYIITYHNPTALDANLRALFDSDVTQYNFEVNVIQNYSAKTPLPDSRFVLPFPKVNIMNNVTRPDWSTGHLARSWNQCLMHGFKNLHQPDCDVLVTMQDDTIVEPDWATALLHAHKTYSFITNGVGDNLVSYLPEAVRKIGIWDERFCNIGYQEGDYFLRAMMYNKNKSCINDFMHGRVHNQLIRPIAKRPTLECNSYGLTSGAYHCVSKQVFWAKWPGLCSSHWGPRHFQSQIKPSQITWVTYPYFEKDLDPSAFVNNNYIVNFNDKPFMDC